MMLSFKTMRGNLLQRVPTCLNSVSQVLCSSSLSHRFLVKLQALKYKMSPLLFSIMSQLNMLRCNKRLLFSSKFKSSKQFYSSNNKCKCNSCKTPNKTSPHMDCFLLISTNWSTFWWIPKKRLLCVLPFKLWDGEWQEWPLIWKDRLSMLSLISIS